MVDSLKISLRQTILAPLFALLLLDGCSSAPLDVQHCSLKKFGQHVQLTASIRNLGGAQKIKYVILSVENDGGAMTNYKVEGLQPANTWVTRSFLDNGDGDSYPMPDRLKPISGCYAALVYYEDNSHWLAGSHV